MCLYVCKYVHKSMDVHVCSHVYICVCTCIQVFVHEHLYTHSHTLHTHMDICLQYTCAHTYTYTWSHAQNNSHTYAHLCTHTHIHMSCVHTHAYTCHVCTHILVQTDVSQTELVICLCRIQLNSPLPGEQVCAFLSCQLRMRACCSWKNLSWNALWFCRGSRAARGKAIFCRLSRSISCLYLDESC